MLMRAPGPPASSMARRSGTAIWRPNAGADSKRRYPGMSFCFLIFSSGLRLCWWVFRVRRLNLLVLWLSLLRSLLVVLSLFTRLVSGRRFAWLIPLLVRCIGLLGLLGLLVRLIAFPRLGKARGTPNKVIDDCA